MNRVSSRQRLVSWDAFDATAPYNSASEEDDEECLSEYQTCIESPTQDSTTPSWSWTTTTDGDLLDTSICSELTIASAVGQKRDRAARRESIKLERALLQLRGGSIVDVDQKPSWSANPHITKTTTRSPAPLQLLDLAIDAQLHIFSFLDLPSLRSVMATSRAIRNLLMAKDAHFVWMNWIQTLWPQHQQQQPKPSAPPSSDNQTNSIPLMDSLQLPTAVGHFEQQDANLAVLLSLAATRHSSTIDVDLFQRPALMRSSRRQSPHARRVSSNSSPNLFVMYKQDNSNVSIVQFRGEVGLGDRCIRAKEPLARPCRLATITASGVPSSYRNHNQPLDFYTSNSAHSRFFLHGLPLTSLNEPHHFLRRQQQHHHRHQNAAAAAAAGQNQGQLQQQLLPITHQRMSLLDMICRGNRSVEVVESNQSNNPYWNRKPFVTPHVVVNPRGEWMLDLTPRLVSYFEVSILNKTVDKDSSTALPPPPPLLDHEVRSECVAVGVASQYFDVHSRMPGWDSLSFGYHGDDGGIFHASGAMLQPYGPCFGVGDTVGCGVDYANGGIFFTLNSNFLGYAWTGIAVSLYLQQDLYPVVGVDTYSPISCNFGERPFSFDLSKFLREQADVVKSACCGAVVVAGSSDVSTTETKLSSAAALPTMRRTRL